MSINNVSTVRRPPPAVWRLRKPNPNPTLLPQTRRPQPRRRLMDWRANPFIRTSPTEASAFKLSPEGEKRHRPHWISLTTAWKPSSTGGTVPEQWHSPSASGGKGPYQPGDELDASDIESLKDASKDLAMEMPIGALSPKAQGKISDALKDTAFELKDVKNKSLNDLSEELGDRASSLGKEIADDLKSNKPGVYYGLGVAGAAAVGVYGYKQGSGALEKLGIKPEFDKSFLTNEVTAKAKGKLGSGDENPNLSLNLNSKLKTSEHGRLAFGAKANIGGEDLKSIDFKGGAGNLGYSHNLSNSKQQPPTSTQTSMLEAALHRGERTSSTAATLSNLDWAPITDETSMCSDTTSRALSGWGRVRMRTRI